MRYLTLHEWNVTPAEAIRIQKDLAGRVCTSGEIARPHFIAGVDISVDRAEKTGTAAVAVLSYPGLEPVETRVVSGPVAFPYVPGLLSFREIPLLLKAFEEIRTMPDLILVDGQGYAHPRRMGIASHLGLLLDVPTIGCAKSRLCGSYAAPGLEKGDHTPLLDDNGGVIGSVLRTRSGTRPVFVSTGHKISLEQAIHWTLMCSSSYRLPEPTRQAHIAAGTRLVSV